jgi:VanZ family protein
VLNWNKKTKLFLAIIWLIVICFLILTPGDNLPDGPKLFPHADKVVHFSMFYLLLILWGFAIDEFEWKISRNSQLLGLLWIGIIFAMVLEQLQKIVPNRNFDYVDMISNVTGVVFGILTLVILHKKHSAWI